jgi:hypothetical protein
VASVEDWAQGLGQPAMTLVWVGNFQMRLASVVRLNLDFKQHLNPSPYEFFRVFARPFRPQIESI